MSTGGVTKVSGNSISSPKSDGIRLNKGKISVVSGNSISSPAGDGIRLSAGTITTVSGNRVKNGILVSAVGVVKPVSGNTVTG